VRQAIQAKRSYPRQARRRQHEGTVVIGFRIHTDGRYDQLRIVESSGKEALDKAALDAVARVGRFAPFPETLDAVHLDFSAPVTFSLSGTGG